MGNSFCQCMQANYMHTSVNCFEHIEFIEYILQVFVGQSISRAESSRVGIVRFVGLV